MKRRVTIKQIAEKAGCSFSAVAKVVNDVRGNAQIGPELSAKIKAVAQELGYHANYHAQRLQNGRANSIGLLLGPQDDVAGIWAPVVDGIQHGCRGGGYDLVLIGSEQGKDVLTRAVRYVGQKRIDAFIVIGLNFRERVAEIASLQVPHVVLFGRTDAFMPHITFDHEPGVQAMLLHLQKLGHRQVVWVGCPQLDISKLFIRYELFKKAAVQMGMTLTLVRTQTLDGDPANQIREARAAFLSYLSTCRKIPTAVIGYNDLATLGVYDALKTKGCRIPEDVSVVGYDDLHAMYACPSMTTIGMNLFEAGLKSSELAIAVSEGKDISRERHWIPTTLVLRESTGPCRAANHSVKKCA